MTNGDAIRRLGDTDLSLYLLRYTKDSKRCGFCKVGIDSKGRCKNPSADCQTEIFNWLGEEYVRSKASK